MDETRTSTADGKGGPQTILDDKYRIERVIGEGAFGRVYLATDTRLRRPVAIKELLATRNGTDPEVYERYLDRFGREARAGGAITNSNVVTVYEMAVDRDRNTYLVMEYVDGTNLRDLLAQVGTLPTERAVAIAADIARGLAAVHEMDIVHRDLKPANVMISRRGEAKVGDFGVAQVGTESQRTQTNMGHPGTPMYMSPEQASGTGYVDGRSDLYSLGLILYEMLTGEPYVRRRVPIRQAKPETPPALAAIVDRLLQGDPNYRFGGAGEVTAELARLSMAPGAGMGGQFAAPPQPAGYGGPPSGQGGQGGQGGPNIPGGYGFRGSGAPGIPPVPFNPVGQGSQGSQGYAPVPPGGTGYGGPQYGGPPSGPPNYGNPPQGGYAPPLQPGGYSGAPGGYNPGGPPPYGTQQFRPPPGPGPQYAAQPPARKRGLSTGAIFGLVGASVVGLIVLGLAILGASGGGEVATATVSAGATTTSVFGAGGVNANLNATSTSLAGTARAVSTSSMGVSSTAFAQFTATASVQNPTLTAMAQGATSTARVQNPTFTAQAREANATSTAILRALTPAASATPAATARVGTGVPALPTIAVPTFSVGTPRPTATRPAGATPSAMSGTYTDPNRRYTFRLPGGFAVQMSENDTVDAELVSANPVGIIRTTSTESAATLSLDLAAAAVLQGLKQSESSFMQQGTTQDVMVNGQPAKRINFTLTDSGVRLQGAMYVMQKARTTVAIAFVSQPNEVEMVIQAGRGVLDSFVFL